MNLVGLMPVRNEDWILGLSARVALMWCDRLVILNHASTDASLAIMAQLVDEFGEGRVQLIADSDGDWAEMEHRQRMLNWARHNVTEAGATHIALIDADEILTGNLIGSIREHVAALSLGQMLTLPLYNLRGGLNRYHLNGLWGQRTVSVAFKDVNTAGWKGDTFHHREPHGVKWQRVNYVHQGGGGIMHLWGASERRLVAKHSLYQCTEALRWPDKSREEIRREYSQSIKGRPWIGDTPDKWTYADVPRGWWEPYDSISGGRYSVDAEPWQEAEVRRLVAEHGRERFAGLDLFGLA